MVKIQYLKDYTPSSWKINKTELDFIIKSKSASVTSNIEIEKKVANITQIDLDGKNLEFISLEIDGKKAKAKNYQVHKDGLIIFDLKKKKHTLTIKNEFVVHQKTEPSGIYSFNNTIYSQCEPEGFREITYFLDMPEIQSKFLCKITAPKKEYPQLLSNGSLIKKGEGRENHWAIWEDTIPKSCYLFALVAGDFHIREVEYKRKNKKNIKIAMYVAEKYKEYCDFALDSIKHAILFDEEVFKLELDVPIYKIVGAENFNAGAMENKGLNIFNILHILASPEITTDEEYIEIDNIIAHEYFHNWTGNRVGIQNWFNLVLKEGLTVFRDQEYSSHRFSKIYQRIKDVRRFKLQQLEENKGQLAHPVLLESYLKIENSYSPSIYLKGAEIFRMLISICKSNFYEGFQKFILKYDKKTATLDQFIACVEKASSKKLEQFKLWYRKVETPQIKVLEYYNLDKATYTLFFFQIDKREFDKGKVYDWNLFLEIAKKKKPPRCRKKPKKIDSLKPNQLQEFPLVKEPFHIPIEIAFFDRNGADMLYIDSEKSKRTKLIQLKEFFHQFTFYNVSQKPLLSFNRNFTAPIEIDFPYSLNELSILAHSEKNPYSRWEAGNEIFIKIICLQIERYLEDKVLFLSDEFILSFQKNITSSILEKTFVYHILKLPSEKEILTRLKNKNTDAVHFVMNYIVKTMSQKLASNFLSLYQQNELQFSFSLEKEEMFKRMIRNTCLYYIARIPEGLDFIQKHYEESPCFSNTIGALKAINDLDCKKREGLMQNVFKKWKKNEVLLCKWFTLQASSTRLKTLDNIKAIITSSYFSLKKSNQVHALLHTFAFNNPYCFHHVSGKGYEFITKYIIKLDTINPPIASSLVASFSQSQNFNKIRQDKIQGCLKKILAKKKLSANLLEVTQKLLQT